MSSGKVLSIDIGKGNIHVVLGSNKDSSVEIESSWSIPTPSGAVKEGVLLERSAVAHALRSLLDGTKGLPSKTIVTVKSTSVITRELTIPEVPEADILPLVLLDMEQYLPNIARDYRTGISILETTKVPTGSQIKVRVFAMPGTMADEYEALLKDCKLKPLALDAHANGINKLVQRNVELAKEKSSKWNWKLAAFVDLGQELTEISILSPDKLLFNRMIPYGSGYMDNELMKQLDVSETALVLKKQELADLSRTDFIGEEARRLNEIIRPYANRVTNEIQTVIQFYSGRVVEKRPEIVYLYGGNAHLKSLAELMEQTLGIPVRLFNDVAAISASPKAGQLDILSHANACAALLRND
jgi:type IV pilus assembly protein PilM